MVNIAVLGYGVVGSGVVEVLKKNGTDISKRAGKEINLKYVLDLREFPGDPVESILVHDYNVILNDPSVDIIVEVMGGVEPAFTFAKQALEAGKSVVTSNKELVAKHGAQLLELAKKESLNFLFEASVGGGIPIIRPLINSLTSDTITEITGILNGTTNYILTRMEREGANFDEVLKDAQALGYAERNPEADVEGYDACRKIAILTSLAVGKQVDYEDIYTEGITKITDIDFKYAKAMHASIKILGTSKLVDGKMYSMVAPFMINEKHPLINVNDVFNGIFVHGDMLDDVMFYGKGAGKLPTASAVVSDVVDAVKHMNVSIMTLWSQEKLELGSIKEAKHRFFVRVKDEDIDDIDVLQVKELFGNVLYVRAENVIGESAFITDAIAEGLFEENIKKVANVKNVIRVDF